MITPRTKLWHKKEFAYVNGYPVVYTVTEYGELHLRLHGGNAAKPFTLTAQGFAVKLPEVLRQ